VADCDLRHRDAVTKPFVILAGVSGTGKSKLPALVGGIDDWQRLTRPLGFGSGRMALTDSSGLLDAGGRATSQV